MLNLIVNAIGELASELGGVRKLATFAFVTAVGGAAAVCAMSTIVSKDNKKIEALETKFTEIQAQIDEHDDIFAQILIPKNE